MQLFTLKTKGTQKESMIFSSSFLKQMKEIHCKGRQTLPGQERSSEAPAQGRTPCSQYISNMLHLAIGMSSCISTLQSNL
jgi:hypothetical protein